MPTTIDPKARRRRASPVLLGAAVLLALATGTGFMWRQIAGRPLQLPFAPEDAAASLRRLAGLLPDGLRPGGSGAAGAPLGATAGLPSPRTGVMQKSRREPAAGLKITAEKGKDYLIKLVNVVDAKDQIVIFLRGGDSYSTKVPLGRYRILGASGHVWYGRDELFGAQTRFFRLHSMKNDDGWQIFHFRQQGNTIYGLDLNLKPALDGTLAEEAIARADF